MNSASHRALLRNASLLFCVAYLLISDAALGQTQIGPLQGRGIAGTVRSKSGAPLDKIAVRLFTADLRPVNTIITDSLGMFQFNGLGPGNYVLVIDEPNFQRVEESVEVYAPGRGPTVVRRSYILDVRPGAPQPESSSPKISVERLKLPKNVREAFEKGEKELNKRNYAVAAEYFDRAIAAAPDFAEALHSRGLVALQMNQPAAAKEFFEKAVAANPENGDSQIGLGSALLRAGDAQAAVEPLSKGLALNPKSYLGHFERCRAYLAVGKFSEADADCSRARELADPIPAGLRILVGNLYLRQNRLPEALREFEEYLKLDSASPTAEQVRAIVKQLRDSGIKPAR